MRSSVERRSFLLGLGGLVGHVDHDWHHFLHGLAIDHFGPAGIWTWLVAGGRQPVVALVIAELGNMPWRLRLAVARAADYADLRVVRSFIGLEALAIAVAGLPYRPRAR